MANKAGEFFEMFEALLDGRFAELTKWQLVVVVADVLQDGVEMVLVELKKRLVFKRLHPHKDNITYNQLHQSLDRLSKLAFNQLLRLFFVVFLLHLVVIFFVLVRPLKKGVFAYDAMDDTVSPIFIALHDSSYHLTLLGLTTTVVPG
jgi:hypothetical protein